MPLKFEIETVNNEITISVPTTESFRAMISALKTISGFKILKICSLFSIITDDCYGRFSIDGTTFDIDTVFSDYYAIIPFDKHFPDEILHKMIQAFHSYKKPWYYF
jgi:hypothetical protein